jgi:metal-responsive CopG/Arc/MetJ family transcriptional regulator
MKIIKGISLSETAIELLDEMAERMGISRSAVVEMAARYFAKHSQDFSEDEQD